jgi:hypothetical protein
MNLAVNDDPSIRDLVGKFHWVIPDELDGYLDWDRGA